MRLSISLPISLLLILLASASASGYPAAGFPWPWPREPRTTTIIDLLSSNAEFGPLLKALQRAALIPLINTSQNITLVAPISNAIDDFDGDLSQDLLKYHILNGSILSNMVKDEIVVESILKMNPKDNRSMGVGVKIEREGDRGRGQGILKIGGVARVVKSDWEATNGILTGESANGRRSTSCRQVNADT
jgi:uncharacterized surface protein with fasciclin (FAS1) repeats